MSFDRFACWRHPKVCSGLCPSGDDRRASEGFGVIGATVRKGEPTSLRKARNAAVGGVEPASLRWRARTLPLRHRGRKNCDIQYDEGTWRSGNFLDYQLHDPGSIPGRDKFIAMLVGVRRPIISPSLKTPKPSEAL